MRPFAFIFLLLLCNVYGLAFDLIAAGSTVGIYCGLLGAQPCLLPPPVDYWLSAVTLLLILPAACCKLAHWFFDGARLLKSTAFLGLLLVAP